MKTVRHGSRARIAAVGLATSSALLLAGCAASNESAPAGGGGSAGGGPAVSGSIAGAGATSQAAAQEAWIAGFTGTNPGATIAYDGGGSGAGRDQFVAGGIQFAGSDAYLDEEELPAAKTRCSNADVVELPLYISPIAVAFNLPGVPTLQLSPAVIAQMFSKKITNWNDPAIAAENAGVQLPNLPITPVNRSDDSGTTENFTEYLSATAPDVWTFKPDGVWPPELAGGEAAQGTSGVIAAISGGQGTIGYADASQAAQLGKVSVKVGDAYVGPEPAAAAAVVEASPRVEGQGQYSFAVDLQRDSTQPGTYPVVLVSYLIACSTYPDAAQADVVKAYFAYMASPEGQEAAAGNAGSAPISDAQRQTFQPAIDAIKAAG